MEQQGTKKLRKVTSGDEQRETAITLASAQVADALQHMVGFLKHDSERLNLALSCKSMHRAVEVYCKAALAKIEQDYHVDETFAERIRDPSLICFPGGFQPVDLPYRYLLKAARFSHLYMLDDIMKGTSSPPTCASALSKDGGRLVVAATLPLHHPRPGDPNLPPLFVYVWDVTAKPAAKKIYKIPAETQECVIKEVFCTEELIVLCTNRRILTVAIDSGNLTHAYTHPVKVRSAVRKGATGVVLFLDDDHKVYAYAFNASTDGMAQFVAQLTFGPQDCTGITGLWNDRWLVVRVWYLGESARFRLFDLSNGGRESDFLDGYFRTMEQSQISPDAFYAVFETGEIQVLQLSERGEFSIVRSFTLPWTWDEDYCREGPQSRWFFEKCRNLHDYRLEEEYPMTVRCSKSGERQGSYKLPANHRFDYGTGIQSNGNEFFVGVEPKDGDELCVAAFLAKEHF